MTTRWLNRLSWRNHCSRSHSWLSHSFYRGKFGPCCWCRNIHWTDCFSWIGRVYNLQLEGNKREPKKWRQRGKESTNTCTQPVLPWLETKLRACVSVNRSPRHRPGFGFILSRSPCNQWGEWPLHSAGSARIGAVRELRSLLRKKKKQTKRAIGQWFTQVCPKGKTWVEGDLTQGVWPNGFITKP